MASNKTVVQRLQRDMRANPVKAGALGLSLAVALWFWGPLVAGWFGGTKPAEPAAPAPATVAAPTTSAAKTTTTDKPTGKGWRQVHQSILNDPNMQPTTLPLQSRDPFTKPQVATKQEGAEPAPSKDITPAEAGIRLSSTVVGQAGKTALVDGRAYREGQTIRAPKGDDRFQLLEIQPRYVVLEHEGKRYKVKLPSVEVRGTDD